LRFAIRQGAPTGKIGDGKIFAAELAMRVRAGERDGDAL
jgi:nitrogen regulatory protein PII